MKEEDKRVAFNEAIRVVKERRDSEIDKGYNAVIENIREISNSELMSIKENRLYALDLAKKFLPDADLSSGGLLEGIERAAQDILEI